MAKHKIRFTEEIAKEELEDGRHAYIFKADPDVLSALNDIKALLEELIALNTPSI